MPVSKADQGYLIFLHLNENVYMKAACYEYFKGPIAIVQLPDPTPGATEVILQVKAIVCASMCIIAEYEVSPLQKKRVDGEASNVGKISYIKWYASLSMKAQGKFGKGVSLRNYV